MFHFLFNCLLRIRRFQVFTFQFDIYFLSPQYHRIIVKRRYILISINVRYKNVSRKYPVLLKRNHKIVTFIAQSALHH